MAAFTILAHDTLTGTAGSWSSSGDLYPIPTTYDHLYLVASARSDKASSDYDMAQLTLGTLSAAAVDHSTTTLYADRSTPNSTRTSSQTFISYFYVPAADVLADTFGSIKIWIPHYSNTTNFKVALGSAAVENNSTSDTEWLLFQNAGLKETTEAINQVTLTLASANFVAASTFTLYGVTGA